jgi:hypothetical protein
MIVPSTLRIAVLGWCATCALCLACMSFSSAQDTAEQESQSIAFVRQHHPELVQLLQRLKDMNREEYESALKEILKVRRRLEALEKRDSELWAVDLDAWKIQSQIDLMLARAVVHDKDFERQSLRVLVEKKVTNQRKRLELEQKSLATRQKQVEESLARLQGNEQERVNQQMTTLLKKVDSKKSKSKKSIP